MTAHLPACVSLSGLSQGDLALAIRSPQPLADTSAPLLSFAAQMPRECWWVKATRDIPPRPSLWRLRHVLAHATEHGPRWIVSEVAAALQCSAQAVSKYSIASLQKLADTFKAGTPHGRFFVTKAVRLQYADLLGSVPLRGDAVPLLRIGGSLEWIHPPSIDEGQERPVKFDLSQIYTACNISNQWICRLPGLLRPQSVAASTGPATYSMSVLWRLAVSGADPELKYQYRVVVLGPERNLDEIRRRGFLVAHDLRLQPRDVTQPLEPIPGTWLQDMAAMRTAGGDRVLLAASRPDGQQARCSRHGVGTATSHHHPESNRAPTGRGARVWVRALDRLRCILAKPAPIHRTSWDSLYAVVEHLLVRAPPSWVPQRGRWVHGITWVYELAIQACQQQGDIHPGLAALAFLERAVTQPRDLTSWVSSSAADPQDADTGNTAGHCWGLYPCDIHYVTQVIWSLARPRRPALVDRPAPPAKADRRMAALVGELDLRMWRTTQDLHLWDAMMFLTNFAYLDGRPCPCGYHLSDSPRWPGGAWRRDLLQQLRCTQPLQKQWTKFTDPDTKTPSSPRKKRRLNHTANSPVATSSQAEPVARGERKAPLVIAQATGMLGHALMHDFGVLGDVLLDVLVARRSPASATHRCWQEEWDHHRTYLHTPGTLFNKACLVTPVTLAAAPASRSLPSRGRPVSPPTDLGWPRNVSGARWLVADDVIRGELDGALWPAASTPLGSPIMIQLLLTGSARLRSEILAFWHQATTTTAHWKGAFAPMHLWKTVLTTAQSLDWTVGQGAVGTHSGMAPIARILDWALRQAVAYSDFTARGTTIQWQSGNSAMSAAAAAAAAAAAQTSSPAPAKHGLARLSDFVYLLLGYSFDAGGHRGRRPKGVHHHSDRLYRLLHQLHCSALRLIHQCLDLHWIGEAKHAGKGDATAGRQLTPWSEIKAKELDSLRVWIQQRHTSWVSSGASDDPLAQAKQSTGQMAWCHLFWRPATALQLQLPLLPSQSTWEWLVLARQYAPTPTQSDALTHQPPHRRGAAAAASAGTSVRRGANLDEWVNRWSEWVGGRFSLPNWGKVVDEFIAFTENSHRWPACLEQKQVQKFFQEQCPRRGPTNYTVNLVPVFRKWIADWKKGALAEASQRASTWFLRRALVEFSMAHWSQQAASSAGSPATVSPSHAGVRALLALSDPMAAVVELHPLLQPPTALAPRQKAELLPVDARDHGAPRAASGEAWACLVAQARQALAAVHPINFAASELASLIGRPVPEPPCGAWSQGLLLSRYDWTTQAQVSLRTDGIIALQATLTPAWTDAEAMGLKQGGVVASGVLRQATHVGTQLNISQLIRMTKGWYAQASPGCHWARVCAHVHKHMRTLRDFWWPGMARMEEKGNCKAGAEQPHGPSSCPHSEQWSGWPTVIDAVRRAACDGDGDMPSETGWVGRRSCDSAHVQQHPPRPPDLQAPDAATAWLLQVCLGLISAIEQQVLEAGNTEIQLWCKLPPDDQRRNRGWALREDGEEGWGITSLVDLGEPQLASWLAKQGPDARCRRWRLSLPGAADQAAGHWCAQPRLLVRMSDWPTPVFHWITSVIRIPLSLVALAGSRQAAVSFRGQSRFIKTWDMAMIQTLAGHIWAMAVAQSAGVEHRGAALVSFAKQWEFWMMAAAFRKTTELAQAPPPTTGGSSAASAAGGRRPLPREAFPIEALLGLDQWLSSVWGEAIRILQIADVIQRQDWPMPEEPAGATSILFWHTDVLWCHQALLARVVAAQAVRWEDGLPWHQATVLDPQTWCFPSIRRWWQQQAKSPPTQAAAFQRHLRQACHQLQIAIASVPGDALDSEFHLVPAKLWQPMKPFMLPLCLLLGRSGGAWRLDMGPNAIPVLSLMVSRHQGSLRSYTQILRTVEAWLWSHSPQASQLDPTLQSRSNNLPAPTWAAGTQSLALLSRRSQSPVHLEQQRQQTTLRRPTAAYPRAQRCRSAPSAGGSHKDGGKGSKPGRGCATLPIPSLTIQRTELQNRWTKDDIANPNLWRDPFAGDVRESFMPAFRWGTVAAAAAAVVPLSNSRHSHNASPSPSPPNLSLESHSQPLPSDLSQRCDALWLRWRGLDKAQRRRAYSQTPWSDNLAAWDRHVQELKARFETTNTPQIFAKDLPEVACSRLTAWRQAEQEREEIWQCAAWFGTKGTRLSAPSVEWRQIWDSWQKMRRAAQLATQALDQGTAVDSVAQWPEQWWVDTQATYTVPLAAVAAEKAESKRTGQESASLLSKVLAQVQPGQPLLAAIWQWVVWSWQRSVVCKPDPVLLVVPDHWEDAAGWRDQIKRCTQQQAGGVLVVLTAHMFVVHATNGSSTSWTHRRDGSELAGRLAMYANQAAAVIVHHSLVSPEACWLHPSKGAPLHRVVRDALCQQPWSWVVAWHTLEPHLSVDWLEQRAAGSRAWREPPRGGLHAAKRAVGLRHRALVGSMHRHRSWLERAGAWSTAGRIWVVTPSTWRETCSVVAKQKTKKKAPLAMPGAAENPNKKKLESANTTLWAPQRHLACLEDVYRFDLGYGRPCAVHVRRLALPDGGRDRPFATAPLPVRSPLRKKTLRVSRPAAFTNRPPVDQVVGTVVTSIVPTTPHAHAEAMLCSVRPSSAGQMPATAWTTAAWLAVAARDTGLVVSSSEGIAPAPSGVNSTVHWIRTTWTAQRTVGFQPQVQLATDWLDATQTYLASPQVCHESWIPSLQTPMTAALVEQGLWAVTRASAQRFSRAHLSPSLLDRLLSLLGLQSIDTAKSRGTVSATATSNIRGFSQPVHDKNNMVALASQRLEIFSRYVWTLQSTDEDSDPVVGATSQDNGPLPRLRRAARAWNHEWGWTEAGWDIVVRISAKLRLASKAALLPPRLVWDREGLVVVARTELEASWIEAWLLVHGLVYVRAQSAIHAESAEAQDDHYTSKPTLVLTGAFLAADPPCEPPGNSRQPSPQRWLRRHWLRYQQKLEDDKEDEEVKGAKAAPQSMLAWTYQDHGHGLRRGAGPVSDHSWIGAWLVASRAQVCLLSNDVLQDPALSKHVGCLPPRFRNVTISPDWPESSVRHATLSMVVRKHLSTGTQHLPTRLPGDLCVGGVFTYP